MPQRSERGLTLTELTAVMVIAALVMVGLVTFYLNSQGMWIDASSQALAQRDATHLLERLTFKVHESSSAAVSQVDTTHWSVHLLVADGMAEFIWRPEDERVHYLETDLEGAVTEFGPVITSKVRRLVLDTDGTMVYIRMLEVDAGVTEPVRTSSSIVLNNRPTTGP